MYIGEAWPVRLMVVEDNRRLAAVMADILRGGGLAVDVAGSVAEAEELLRAPDYDLVLLDLALPDGDGASLLRAMRRRGIEIPVLVTTARGEVVDRVELLNAGADDYLVKPFSLDELLARARALLRRPRRAERDVLGLGNISLDTTAQVFTVAGNAVDITRLEFRILATLLMNRGALVPRARLEQAVYSVDAEVTPNAIEVAISRLRRRLAASGADVAITAMRGLGYAITETASA